MPDTKYFDKATDTIHVPYSDVKGVLNIFRDSDVLFDIFLILVFIGLGTWIMLFLTGLLGYPQFSQASPIIGYIITILVLIASARSVYSHVSDLLHKRCNTENGNVGLNPDYILESSNRFYNVFTFTYFYVKTHIITLLNLAIIYLAIHLFVMSLKTNLNPESSGLVNFFNDKLSSSSSLPINIASYIYIAIGAFVFVMVYFAIISYYAENLFDINHNNSMRSVSVVSSILLVFFIPAILYLNEQYVSFIMSKINKNNYTINSIKKEFNPLFEIFISHKLLNNLNFLNKEEASLHIYIFFIGLIFTILYAVLVLPTFDVDKFCAKKVKGENDEEYQKMNTISSQYDTRFRFGFFLSITTIIFMHLGKLLLRFFLFYLSMPKSNNSNSVVPIIPKNEPNKMNEQEVIKESKE